MSMHWRRSTSDIAAAWENEIAAKLESGATPLIMGGAPQTTLPSAATLLALQQTIARRQDVTMPLLVAGGSGAAWLGLLLPPLPVGEGHYPLEPTVIYGGVDDATYLATLGSIAGDVTAPISPIGAFPLEAMPFLAPRLAPGAPAPWEAMPFAEAGERLPASGTQAETSERGSGMPEAGDWGSDWIGWGAMLLALSLVVSALLI